MNAPMLDGSAAFLQQAYRNNWQQYLSSLQPGSNLGWDVCVLTASDERQAGMYRQQLKLRRKAGLLPSHTRFEVMADPDGRRIGSGGATLRVLARLLDLAPSMPPSPIRRGGMLSERVLIIHSGGDSRRLPHCSATGKLFARVPHELPDGRAATVFDEFLVTLSGLTANLRPGVLIASGDVLLVFDHLQLSFQRAGVTGVSAAAPVAMGQHHGVYVPAEHAHTVRAYLHKPSPAELAAWDAVREESVQIDTGLVWVDAPTAQRLTDLLQEEAVAALCGEPLPAPHELAKPASPAPSANGHKLEPPQIVTGQFNLYGDLLLPLAESTSYDAYLADTSDGPCTLAIQRARQVIWQGMRGMSFACEQLQPAVFIHFGSTAEYVQTACTPTLRHICNWVPQAAAWAGPALYESPLALMNATMEGPLQPGSGVALVVDSQLSSSFEWHGGVLVSGLRTAQPLSLAENVAVSQMPVLSASTRDAGWVTRIYGLGDNPKCIWNDIKATYLNRSWADWFAATGIEPEDVWPDLLEQQRSLWNAHLFPFAQDREESLCLALPLQLPATVDPGWRAAWRHAERLSLQQCFRHADANRLIEDISDIEDHVAARRFYAAVEAGQPAASARRWLGKHEPALLRRCDLVNTWLAQADPMLQIRGNKALSVATGDQSYETRAFATLATTIGASVTRERSHQLTTDRVPAQVADHSPISNNQSLISPPIRVACAARIDFGGGWTDTPPYSIERGGCVLNAAVTLRGAYPIVAEAALLDEPKLVLESKDLDARIEPETVGDLLSYANPADPFALLKAALVVRGLVSVDCDPAMPVKRLLQRLGAGLWLCTQTHIPRGSGLGTSSILAGAVLEVLRRLLEGTELGTQYSALSTEHSALLFDEVLWLEQLLTTGGGWQDQVGGLTGGIKLLTSQPGLPQRIHLEPVRMPHHAQAELAERLLLVYTGQQRLAKNLLQAIVGRWMGRDTDMTWMLGQIARLGLSMRDALAGGDLDSFGWLLAEHWSINKRMDPGCSNPFIDSLFDTMQPFICGGKLVGAGGGGFAIVLAKDAQAAHDLKHDLTIRYRRTPVALWACDMPQTGVHV